MEQIVRHYSELSTDELYRILRERVNIFVVEQNCPYPELDDRDQSAYHFWIEEDGKILSYLRLLPKDDTHPYITIGRVLSSERRKGYASELIKAAIQKAEEIWDAKEIFLMSQVYARSLYEKLGFVQISDEYLEDGIPHIDMLRKRESL